MAENGGEFGEAAKGDNEMSKLEVVIYKQDLEDVITALEWAMTKGSFECDCEPTYESDTNAWNHKDSCSMWMEDHVEITLKSMRKFREATKTT